MKRAFGTLALALVVTAGACSSAAGRTGTPVQRNVISAEEIRKAGVGSLYQLVQTLRPNWLVKRGQQSFVATDEIIVYLDRSKLGTIEVLRDINANTATSVQFLDPAAANYRFGQGHPHGAIVISTAAVQ